jgi:hypothetical protein
MDRLFEFLLRPALGLRNDFATQALQVRPHREGSSLFDRGSQDGIERHAAITDSL